MRHGIAAGLGIFLWILVGVQRHCVHCFASLTGRPRPPTLSRQYAPPGDPITIVNTNWVFLPSEKPHSSRCRNSALASTKSPFGSTTSQTTDTSSSRSSSSVVFQKVVRPYGDLADILFLGYLVEYLQDRFEIPDHLPMVYRKEQPNDDGDDDDDSAAQQGIVVQWDSPLSPDSSRTCLRVQVVGIFTDNVQQVPNMAMVVVDKPEPSSSSSSSSSSLTTKNNKQFPPMLVDLFADSERKILKALDRGLDDFMAGKIRGLGESNDSHGVQQPKIQTFREGRDAILEELLQDDNRPAAASTDMHKNGFIDADVTQKNGVDIKPTGPNGGKRATQSQREAALKMMNESAKDEPIETAGLEFAVQAAKQAHAKRQRKKEQELNDFAVLAAKKASARRARLLNESSDDANRTVPRPDPDSIDLSKIRPPILDPKISGVQRSFMTSISNPRDYAERRQAKNQKVPLVGTKESLEKATNDVVTSSSTMEVLDDNVLSNKKLNLSVQKNAREPIIEPTEASDEDEHTKTMIQAAEEALSEMEEKGKEMSPEELLESVIQFGEQQERENTVGVGFVSGAFEKAKDLLREQKEKRESRITSHRTTTGLASAPDILDLREGVREISADEELRRMFEAGERIADGRITRVKSSSETTAVASPSTVTTEDDIDALISQEKTISRHARILDDELAELEVRINKSPGQDTDGPTKNPLFDIFSGPEVYNPNVDPETAVNWPGAKRGTRQIRLPKELDEAVKQAKFAAEVLVGLKAIETSDGLIKYTIGNRELTKAQVANFQSVVEEAVEIGLIDNPLEIRAEASRLQMLLDELRSQPEERVREISSNYKDLLLSDNFPQLLRQRLNEMADRDLEALRNDDDSLESVHSRERELLAHLIGYAQLLLKETRALGAELESQQLEIVRSICKVAMDPSHRTEEEAAMALTDAVRDMRPLFDDCFIAYLKYSVAEEEGRLARAGLLDDPDHNQWLFVLKIVQQGVYAEIARGINRYVEHIWYILRMETPEERRMLLQKLVDVMPTLDVRPFVQVVENIVGSLGHAVSGDFDGVHPLGEMTNKLLQLRRDVKEVLPPERIAEMSKDADEWAVRQKKRLLEQRNLTKQRLKASQATEHLDAEIESFGKSGEVERFE